MQSANPQLDIKHLRLVAAIAANGTLTAAATALGLTQPALSHQLRELETKLRTPLFQRTTRRMVPTVAGEHLARLAQSVLLEIETFERQLSEPEIANVHGVVRIATECYTCYHWLPPVLKAFRERWPGVEIRVAAEHTGHPIAALREGSLDLAIVHRPVSDHRISLATLFDDECVAITAPDHPFAGKRFVAPSDFSGEHLVLYTSDQSRSWALQDVLDPAGVIPARVSRVQLTEAIIELVAAGLGISILARWAVAPAIRAGLVAGIPITDRGYRRRWFAATRVGEPSAPYAENLLDLLRRHVAGGPRVAEFRIA